MSVIEFQLGAAYRFTPPESPRISDKMEDSLNMKQGYFVGGLSLT